MSRRSAEPDDGLIREALVRRLVRRYRRDENVILIHELGLREHRGRLDLAAVTDRLEGYEIKSDRDGHAHLANQIEVYGAVLDRVTLVGGPRALERAAGRVPEWWGLWEAPERGTKVRIVERRRPRANPAPSTRGLAETLWRDEALAMLRRHGLGRGLAHAARARLWERIAEALDHATIRGEVLERLRQRRYDRRWGGTRKVRPFEEARPRPDAKAE